MLSSFLNVRQQFTQASVLEVNSITHNLMTILMIVREQINIWKAAMPTSIPLMPQQMHVLMTIRQWVLLCQVSTLEEKNMGWEGNSISNWDLLVVRIHLQSTCFPYCATPVALAYIHVKKIWNRIMTWHFHKSLVKANHGIIVQWRKFKVPQLNLNSWIY